MKENKVKPKKSYIKIISKLSKFLNKLFKLYQTFYKNYKNQFFQNLKLNIMLKVFS